MGKVNEISGGFELNLSALLAQRIGSEAQASSPLFPREDVEAGGAIPLFALSRGEFIAGLSEIWKRGCPARLCPNEKHQAQATANISPMARFFVEQDPIPREILRVSDRATIAQVLTSGSTGSPRVHNKTARQLLGEALTLVTSFQLGEEDTVLATTAVHHVYGLLFGVLAPWAAGSKIITDATNEANAFHPQYVANLTAEYGATRIITVPAHLRAILEARPSLQGVRQVICSAAPLDPSEAARFEDNFGIEVVDILGSTETGGIATRRSTQSPIWRPLPGVSLSIDEHEQLSVSSPFAGDDSQSLATGEHARLFPDGSFEYLGRHDGIVKVGGKRVHLREVEVAAQSLAGVQAAFALSRSVSSLRGEEILLVVESTKWKRGDLRRALRDLLDPSFVPRKVRIVAALPHDERGKITRSALLQLFDHPRKVTETERDGAALGPSGSLAQGAVQPGGEVSHAPTRVTLQVPVGSERFSGHFPDAPIFPAVAQLIDIILPEIRKHSAAKHLCELRRIKWMRPILPGDQLTLEVRPTPEDANRYRFEISRGEERTCSGIAVMGRLPQGST